MSDSDVADIDALELKDSSFVLVFLAPDSVKVCCSARTAAEDDESAFFRLRNDIEEEGTAVFLLDDR